MSLNWLLPLLIAAALLLTGVGAVRRVRLWRQGRPAKVDLLGGLLAMPKRYLVDLHHVVARDKYIARTHVATAAGFVAAVLLVLVVHVLGIESRLLAWALLLALAVMLIGAVFVAHRRWPEVPARLSKGPWNRLPVSLMIFALSFALVTLPAAGILPPAAWGWGVALVLSLLLAWGLGEMVFGMTWGGPMKHAFAGAAHLAFHPRPQRFTQEKRATELQAVDLEASKLGVETPRDFAWNRLLGFDACVQCGRCEAACPAFAAGQPLNPKKLIQDLVVGLSGPGSDAGYRGSPYPGREVGHAWGAPDQAIVPQLIPAETLWSCTTCRACVYECPMMIEHVDAIIDLRRYLTLEKGETPGKGAQILEELQATDNPNGYDPASRSYWAADLDLPRLADKGETEILFWAGDGAFELRNQRTLRAVVRLLRTAGVDFAVLGDEELDSGDVARRLGDDATFQGLARRNIEILATYRFRRILTADPHVLHTLKNEYPALGGHYEVVHHTTLFAELVKAGRLQLDRRNGQHVTYHDPCYLGRYNGEIDAPRFLLKEMGVTVKEMERSGLHSRCCGGGGGAPLTDIPGKQRIPDIRIEDARRTGAQVVAVACPNCAVMLEGVVHPRPDIKDVAELLAESVQVTDS
jgi:Fe-S oxidoreductase